MNCNHQILSEKKKESSIKTNINLDFDKLSTKISDQELDDSKLNKFNNDYENENNNYENDFYNEIDED